MFSWSQRSGETANREDEEWPPLMNGYEEYKKEMDALVLSHPPFGEWLKRYRNELHVVKGGGEAFSGMNDAQGLAKRYAEEERKRKNGVNARRYICELHLKEAQEELKQEEEEAWKKEEEEWKKAVLEANGIRHIPKPPPPPGKAKEEVMKRVLIQIEESPEAGLMPTVDVPHDLITAMTSKRSHISRRVSSSSPSSRGTTSTA